MRIEGGHYEAAAAKTDRKGRVRPTPASHAGAKRGIWTTSADHASAACGAPRQARLAAAPLIRPALPATFLPLAGEGERIAPTSASPVEFAPRAIGAACPDSLIALAAYPAG